MAVYNVYAVYTFSKGTGRGAALAFKNTEVAYEELLAFYKAHLKPYVVGSLSNFTPAKLNAIAFNYADTASQIENKLISAGWDIEGVAVASNSMNPNTNGVNTFYWLVFSDVKLDVLEGRYWVEQAIDGGYMYYRQSEPNLYRQTVATYTGDASSWSTTFIEFTVPQSSPVISITANLENCTCEPLEVTSGVETEITLTASSGYEFTQIPTITVDGVSNEFTLDDTKTIGRCTLTAAATSVISVDAVAAEIPVPISINSSRLGMVTVDNLTAYANQPCTINIKAYEGYEITGTPSILVNGVSTYDFTVSDDRLAASVTFTITDKNVVLAAVCETQKIEIVPETITVSTQLTNAALSPLTVTEGVPTLLTVTAAEGYEFKNAPTININGTIAIFVLNNDSTATYNVTAAKGDVVIVSGEAVEKPAVTPIAVSTNVTGFTITPQITSYNSGESVTITAAPLENYEVVNAPQVEVWINNIYTGADKFTLNGGVYTIDLSTVEIEDLSASQNVRFVITGSATPKTQTDDKYGLISVYNPTADELADLSKVRFTNMSSGETEDLGRFIVSLKSIPVSVSNLGKQAIILGNTTLKVSAFLVNEETARVELPPLEIKGKYQNALDARYAEIKISLPFYGIYELDSEKWLNQTVVFSYEINLISGMGVISVFMTAGENKILIDTLSVNCAFDVPYVLDGNDLTINNQNVATENLFTSPIQLTIFENNIVGEENERMVYDVSRVARIGECNTGEFIRAREILEYSNQEVITGAEYEEIKQKLLHGIII